MLTTLLTLAGVAWAFLPWWLLVLAIRGARRCFRPRRRLRNRGLPVEVPGNPATGTLWLLLLGVIVASWTVYTRPLWLGYGRDALDYRREGAPLAEAVSAAMLSTGQPLGGARLGHGYFAYSLGPAGETTRAVASYYYGGVPVPAPPGETAPVLALRRDGPDGTLLLTYRKDLPAETVSKLRAAFEGVDPDPGRSARRAAVDLPLLVRSAKLYWQDWVGYLDAPGAAVRCGAGLPALPPMLLFGLCTGAMPGR